jgi:hypothetical protein
MDSIRCTCENNCQTYGQCMRRKNIHVGQVDRTEQKKWDAELSAYRAARKQGIQPATTQMPDILAANEISERNGRAFSATDPSTFL